MPRHEGAAEGPATMGTTSVDGMEGETPRGTLFVLLLYAGVLVALWGYTYVSLILRR